jgi:uncharacterized protein YdgA (DUF945 family)
MTTAATTTIEHPPLPGTATLIERLVLPAVFSVVINTVKNPKHADDLKEYMLAIRDAISSAYPGE